ncbi:MAG: phosphoribosylformylglycinamidine synthase subunit PurS [Flavobacteriales bacterium]|nr:phosphoribosylformylglycinamidine synthase subunit PurS [Flavobacteriales bacterium]
MTFHAAIDIMPLPSLLDPQGKAVSNNMSNVGLPQIGEVRIGKHITLTVEADDAEAARALVSQACEKLLANPIMEGFTFMIEEVETA